MPQQKPTLKGEGLHIQAVRNHGAKLWKVAHFKLNVLGTRLESRFLLWMPQSALLDSRPAKVLHWS